MKVLNATIDWNDYHWMSLKCCKSVRRVSADDEHTGRHERQPKEAQRACIALHEHIVRSQFPLCSRLVILLKFAFHVAFVAASHIVAVA